MKVVLLCWDKSKKHFFYLQDCGEIIVEVRERGKLKIKAIERFDLTKSIVCWLSWPAFNLIN